MVQQAVLTKTVVSEGQNSQSQTISDDEDPTEHEHQPERDSGKFGNNMGDN